MKPRRRDPQTNRLSPIGAGRKVARAIVLVPLHRRAGRGVGAAASAAARSPEARLAEATGLARAIDLDVVQAGDSVSGIADTFGVSAARLAEVNQILNPDDIQPGTQLTIPPALSKWRP